jgi:predicted tellurium resistance membrane protein TerC
MANIIKNKNENNDNLIENKETFALNKINYIIMAIAVVVIIIGFALMTGQPNGAEFNEDVFSTRRIVVAPTIAFLGFLMVIVAILWKPKKK